MATITKTGSFVGTGAAVNVSVGFIPDYVKIINTTDGDQIDEWFNGMAAATSISNTSAAVATRAAPNGISSYDGSTTAGEGFTAGAGISETGKTLFYIAIQNGPGAA